MPEISIIVPIYNEEKYIRACIESLLSCDYDEEKMELLLVDGGSSDKTVEIITQYQKKYRFIKLLHNPKKIAPVAMNIGIEASKGEMIFIISAHAVYAEDYFTKLVQQLQVLDADCVGPVLTTEVKNRTKISVSIRDVLSHKFGVGSRFRSEKDLTKPIEVDTVPFGCYRKEVFEKYGGYDERLVRNQDIELNKRITNGGGKIYLVPDVKCTYYARESLLDLAKNNFQNGKWNILTAYYAQSFKALSLRHFIPLFFVLSLCLPLLASFIDDTFLWLSAGSLFSYLTLVIIISLKVKNRTNSVGYLILSFMTLHLSYGIGSIVGIFSVIKKKIKGSM